MATKANAVIHAVSFVIFLSFIEFFIVQIYITKVVKYF